MIEGAFRLKIKILNSAPCKSGFKDIILLE